MTIITHSLAAQPKTTGSLVVENPAFYELVDKNAQIEVLAEGFKWSEGPVWVKEGSYLLFSDVPANTIYKWEENKPLEVFLKPSGYTGKMPYSNEPGSNGLIINIEGQLVACEHGDRRLTQMPLNGKGGKFPITDNWNGKRYNSPNDVVQSQKGTYFFTDPPYGLADYEKDASREINEFGIYKVSISGQVTQVISDLIRPNGVALSPDEKILYVAQSDPDKAYILAYDLDKNENPINGRVLFDATEMVKKGLKGLPDGLKTDKQGNIFTTGPGGVLILSPKGELLGRIDTDQPTSNCNWGDDGSYLYMTANNFLCRIKTKTIGKGF
ncbi:gluconolactonase [Spirosomataceae bacterium TFI 002]|nr:gluconolactonase [Spirosomataceae bacterium TFI 002]